MPLWRASPAGQAPVSARRAVSTDRRGDRGGQAREAPYGRHRPNVRVACSRQLPGRCAEVTSGAAARGLARGPGLAAAAGGGIGAAMGLTDPTDPGGEGDAVEIGGPLPAAPIEMARSGCAHVEPCAAQEAASEQGPGTGPPISTASPSPPEPAGSVKPMAAPIPPAAAASPGPRASPRAAAPDVASAQRPGICREQAARTFGGCRPGAWRACHRDHPFDRWTAARRGGLGAWLAGLARDTGILSRICRTRNRTYC